MGAKHLNIGICDFISFQAETQNRELNVGKVQISKK